MDLDFVFPWEVLGLVLHACLPSIKLRTIGIELILFGFN